MHHKRFYNSCISLFLFMLSIISPLFASETSDIDVKAEDCVGCHQEQYEDAMSYKYQHSIIEKACVQCHVLNVAQGNTKTVLTFATFQKEQIVQLENLDPEVEYEAEVTVTDNRRKRSLPRRIRIHTVETLKQSSKFPELNEISNVSIEELWKGGFVRAVISWDTNTYSTSELEFSTDGNHPRTFDPGNIFARNHRVILSGLRHNSMYQFRVISRDMYGNLVQSQNYPLDTSKTISHSGKKTYQPPSVNSVQVFGLEGESRLFLKVSANKPAELRVKLIEVRERDTRHGFGLLAPLAARIDTCLKCHPRGTSHPVGVKAEGDKIRTPDELPTIEDGIITCVTCHNPHGGNNAFFARFDRNKDICILCHIGGY